MLPGHGMDRGNHSKNATGNANLFKLGIKLHKKTEATISKSHLQIISSASQRLAL